MNPCIICYGPCDGPRLPPCGHVHCKLCFRRNTKASEFHCEWPECERRVPLEEVHEQQTYADPDHQERGSQVSQHDIELAYSRQQQLASKDSMAGEDEYVVTLFLLLSKVVSNCKAIRRFHENADGDKLVLHIKPGTQDTVTAFLKKENFLEENSMETHFELVEQSKAPKFLVATGAKLTSEALLLALESVTGVHPDTLQQPDRTATVACLGLDRHNQLHVLTAKHLFGGGQTETGTGNFISCHQNKLQVVSTRYHGKVGAVPDQQGQSHLVDIAALPLEKHIEDAINPNLVHQLRPIFQHDAAETYRRLRKKTVYKHGATSGTTCGVIENALCYLNEETTEDMPALEGLQGTCLLINSTDSQRFADAGDSGALIWDENGTPIGLVALSDEYGLTYGVRLDHCLAALEQLQAPVEIRPDRLKAVGAPIPVLQFPDTDIETRDPPWTLEQEAMAIM